MSETSAHTIAYACMSAIGNSLVLEEMLMEVILTFAQHTGASGGKYIVTSPALQSIALWGKEFEIPDHLSDTTESYTLHSAVSSPFILDIPLKEGHLLFAYQEDKDLESFGSIFSALRTKLTNAIDGCRNVKRLHELNTVLTDQMVEAKSKHEITEKLMITQSRMAIMGEMIGMIAHQWRQPITIIGMITNNTMMTLEFDELDKHQLREDLNVIDKQIHYLSATIDDFRHFFRPNKLPLNITAREISKDVLTILGKNYKNSGINLTFSGDLDAPFVTYKNELLQVFLNILANAKDAFEERSISEPFILFKTSHIRDVIEFSIQDNAGGIPQQIVDKIFDPYFSTKAEKNGTGLGLYMSAVIIEKHLGGTIGVTTDAEGSLFKIAIPLNYDKDMTYVF